MNDTTPAGSVGNFFEYLGAEETNFLVTLNNLRAEFDAFSHLDGLYRTAIDNACAEDEEDLIIFQLLLFVHYHLYHSAATLLRCHMSDALASMRTAIEAGLAAYRIIDDRQSQLQYVLRSKSLQSHKRFFKKAWETEPEAFPLAHPLLNRWDACSRYGSHADIDVFVHRLTLPEDGSPVLKLQYFQHPKNR
jgi:hypothetical protein